MAGSAENPKIGLSNVVIAELISYDGVNPPVYGNAIPLVGAVQASVNPNSSVETDYADNGAFFVTGNRANTEMSLEMTNVAPATLAKMLGQERANGVTLEKPLDQAPYFALGFKVWIGGTDANGNKIFEMFWYAKGKFSVPESGGTTKQDSIDFQHVSLTAQFVPTLYKPDGNSGVICAHARTDIDTPAATVNNWFNAPVISTNLDSGAVTVAIESSDANTITITGSKAGGGDCEFAEATVNADNIVIISGGSVVAGAFTVNENVITFVSASAMSGTVYVSVSNSVKDVNGVGVTPAIEELTI